MNGREAVTVPMGIRTQSVARFRVFWALVVRDLVVLRKRWLEFSSRTILQPLLLVYVFTYVFPNIGQVVGEQHAFNASLVAGVLAVTIMVQGIQAVSLPLVQEFGHTREIEDRVLAPLPLSGVALAKVFAGALQCMAAGILVFPIAWWLPAEPIAWVINWPLLLVLFPLVCILAGAVGLVFGTVFEPRTVPVLFGVIVVPLTFLGCVYYSWQMLATMPWLQYAVLVNPLVYASEGLRAALTGLPTMPVVSILTALSAFTTAFLIMGCRSFSGRVIS